ncbi:DUF3310 domain-containing protein [Mesosutterella sp. OilRF-GAM-744-9]|uniref:DUF3310 domain-containing protein n=1 Tax=Mesosutterella porci TaxID=2915351 RepID=A0ABS9MUL7_9BURK|nr:DUF3310 domain-containing protein [Mesosutterella sp. oilRF-744-WT-GAM-9]MCG5031703.1 DUF3310 domain-containing protein [Mesosutterella sp. oilRF-744-WT-GAM-9]
MGQVKVWPKDERAKDVVMNHGEEIKKLKAGGQTIPQLAMKYQVDPKVIRQVLHDYWPRWKEEPKTEDAISEVKAEAPAPAPQEEKPAKALESDPVNHPAHYTKYTREVIELTERCSFCLGNAFKYILRAPFKGRREEDIDKSLWYLDRYFSEASDFNPDIAGKYFASLAWPYVMDLMEWQEYELCSYFLGVIKARDAKGAERRRAWLKFKELAEEAKKGVGEEGK